MPATKSNARARSNELSAAQLSAIDLLAAGKNDTETAALLNLNRVTVTRWRLYGAQFRAALAQRRADVWGTAADKLRALVPKAIDALACAFDDETRDRVDVALAVLKLAGPLPLLPTEPTDPDDQIRAIVDRERAQMRDDTDDRLDALSGKVSYADHTEAVHARLADAE
jgi:hypothetical protein